MTVRWRLGGWPADDLAGERARLHGLARSFPERGLEEMTPADGWRPQWSEAVVARERPGPAGETFARLARAVAAYRFSDPRIVEGHFDPGVPLEGRRMLLEIRTGPLSLLGGVAVAATRDDEPDGARRFGFRYDTLEGHLEEGAEWFLLEKDIATGEIRFRIEARWRLSRHAPVWMRAGFAAVGPRYQRLWHRRAHERLHAVAAGRASATPRRGEGRLAVRFADRPLPARHAAVEAGLLGAMTGVRSVSGFALLARTRSSPGPGPGPDAVERALSSPVAAPVTAGLAIGEMVADKTPWIPPRTDPAALGFRIVNGALGGSVLARQRAGSPAALAAIGGASALATALGTTALRRRISRLGRLGGIAGGLAEDALVVAIGLALGERLRGEAAETRRERLPRASDAAVPGR